MSRTVRLLAAAALATAVLPALGGSTTGAAAADPLYRPLSNFELSGDNVRITPDRYAAVRIDLAQARSELQDAPRAADRAGMEFSVPTPAGGTERFLLHATRTMEAELAAAHPEITTYAGRSLENAGTTIALDITPMGLHASVRDPQGQRAWYVDPAYDRPGTTTHLSYYGGAVPRAEDEFIERETPEIRQAMHKKARLAKAGAPVTQKIYRLAFVTDPSYAAYFGTDTVLAEKTTLINRVNQIYNDDLAVKMLLIDETDELNLDTEAKATGANGPCGAHPCFDPRIGDPDNDAGTYGQLEFCDGPTLGRNRVVLGQLVGAANYDVGHIGLGVNGGGIAYLGVVGWDYKGGGCTGLPEPKGDFFAIDYVAHELGHQFSGNHSFNGDQWNCGPGNRNPDTSFEPGSGSSVMAYAGICRQDNLQPHSDPYFAAGTVDEVNAYLNNPTLPVVEVQTVSLSGFDADGEKITLGFGAKTPVTLTRGTDYNAAGIEAAVEQLTGKQVSVAKWGYDPFGDFEEYPAPAGTPDDTGFQVTFAPTLAPDDPSITSTEDIDTLTVTSPSAGVTGFVGETAKGGEADNGGDATVVTGNHAPTVRAPGNKTIPLRTPFMLKGSGKDSDGDKLIYLWEQMDIGGANGTELVDNKKRNGPLFRMFGTAANVTDEGTLQSPSPGENLASSNSGRYFPDLAQVLAGQTNAKTGKCPAAPPLPPDDAPPPAVSPKIVNCFSEFLPIKKYVGTAGSKTPAMHFRLTARDGFDNGGGVGHDDVTLRIAQNAGPFLVTSFAKGGGIKAGAKRVITWKVNGTQRLAKKVRILLSTDGGKTWNKKLVRATPNDGRAKIQIPRVSTHKARIMISAIGNYFYDVNDKRFTIRR
jgi:hypothetical protein